MDRTRKFLVAVDFSPCSASAFVQGARFAEWTSASLSALHVIDILELMAPVDPMLPIAMPIVPMEDLVRAARRRWEGFVPDCAARASTSLEIVFGSPRGVILETTQQRRPDLLIVGARGASKSSRGLGPVASACVQRAAAPVLVVRGGKSGPFTSVLACVDFSEASGTALAQAICVAAKENATLHVLHVYADPWRGLDKPREVRDLMPDFDERFEAAIRQRLREFCSEHAEAANRLDIHYHAVQAEKHGEGINRFARRRGCDLVVLGTRGKWNVRDFFWGSTAERVVRECHCSVLAVKPPGFGGQERTASTATAEPVPAPDTRVPTIVASCASPGYGVGSGARSSSAGDLANASGHPSPAGAG